MSSYERAVIHIRLVQSYLALCAREIARRQLAHDESKLIEPELSAYEGLGELSANVLYGSEQYKQIINEHLGTSLEHHYLQNDHHPEHFANGVQGMNLFQLLEMLCDIKAVCSEKKTPADITRNLEVHGITGQLAQILQNTIDWLNKSE